MPLNWPPKSPCKSGSISLTSFPFLLFSASYDSCLSLPELANAFPTWALRKTSDPLGLGTLAT